MDYLRNIKNGNTYSLLRDKRSGIFDLFIWILAFYLFLPTILWIARSFSHSSNTFSTLIVLVIIALLIKKIHEEKTIGKIFNSPLRYSEKMLPYLTFIFSVACYILLGRFLKINIFQSVFFALSLFSLSGFYLPPKTWKKGLLPLMFFILALPFGNSLDTYLGFPMRIFSTKVSGYFLSGLGIEHITRETIIIIENSAAKVDNSCSGLKGIWSGLLFFFGATWIEQKRAGLSWFAALMVFIFSLTAFNILRIVILVLTQTAFGLTKTAEAIHVPLGITGFVFSCMLAWFLIKKIPENKKEVNEAKNKTGRKSFSMHIYGIIILLLLFGIFVTGSKSNSILPVSKRDITLKLSAFHFEPADLTSLEKEFLIKSSDDFAVKKRFKFKNLTGTFLISINNNWRRHHSPEECMAGSGLKMDGSVTRLMEKDFPVKFTSLQDGKLSASYWFQSDSFTTDDFSSRVWAQIMGREKNWALVSVLFDQKINPSDKDVKQFHIVIFKEIQRIFKKPEENKND